MNLVVIFFKSERGGQLISAKKIKLFHSEIKDQRSTKCHTKRAFQGSIKRERVHQSYQLNTGREGMNNAAALLFFTNSECEKYEKLEDFVWGYCSISQLFLESISWRKTHYCISAAQWVDTKQNVIRSHLSSSYMNKNVSKTFGDVVV